MTTTPIATTKNGTTTPPVRGGASDERELANSKPPAEGTSPKAPALPVDLAAQPDEVLALLADEVPREQQRRQAKREADLVAEFKERARALGVPPARLAAALGIKVVPGSAKPSMLRPASTETSTEEDGRRHVKPKYRNPKDPSQTWSGRGAPPQWVADHLAAGGSKEDLAIVEGTV